MKSLFEVKSDRALIIGAGSGRDMASAILVRELLKNSFSRVDLAGFLTPWALHSFEGKLERPVNQLAMNAKKFIPFEEDRPLNVFYEPLLIDCNEEFNLGISHFYLMSLQYGYEKLLTELLGLIEKRQYDTIVVVDIGGDILASSEDYGTLLTPIVDLTCLELIATVPSSINAYLAVVSPGVCGEIGYRRLEEIYRVAKRDGSFIEQMPYKAESTFYKKFRALNQYINKKTNSYSHTEHTINFLIDYNEHFNYKTEYLKKYRIYDSEFTISFPVELSREFRNSVSFFDLKKVRETRKEFPIKFKSVLEIFLKMRVENKTCGTEVDGAIVVGSIAKNIYSNPILLLTPCCYATVEQRKEIVGRGLKAVSDGNVENAILLKEDYRLLQATMHAGVQWIEDNYLLVSREDSSKAILDLFTAFSSVRL